MTTKKVNHYSELAKIDVSQHIEKKGRFSYLSWSWAVHQLRSYDPTATWEVIRFNGFPFLKSELGYFVEVAVTVQGVTLSQIHPVLNNYNKPIAQPTSFDINTSIQRCLVKAIALHGIGLSIYAGEDLPFQDENVNQENKSGSNESSNQAQENSEPRKPPVPMTGKQKEMIEERINDITLLVNKSKEEVIKSLQNRVEFNEFDSMNVTQANRSIEYLTKWKTSYSNAAKQ